MLVTRYDSIQMFQFILQPFFIAHRFMLRGQFVNECFTLDFILSKNKGTQPSIFKMIKAKSCHIDISCDITLFVNCQQGALKIHCQENLYAGKDTLYEVIC